MDGVALKVLLDRHRDEQEDRRDRNRQRSDPEHSATKRAVEEEREQPGECKVEDFVGVTERAERFGQSFRVGQQREDGSQQRAGA